MTTATNKFAQGDYIKTDILLGRNDTFYGGRYKSINGNFSGEGNKLNTQLLGRILSHSQGFS